MSSIEDYDLLFIFAQFELCAINKMYSTCDISICNHFP